MHLNKPDPIIHRDIKAENILMESVNTKDIRVKLSDFGFSHVFKEKQENFNQVLGSPQYMAPEIVNGQKYDSKVDIWSLGQIVHVLLTGQTSFMGNTAQ